MRNVENGREEEARESKLTPPSKMSRLPSVERHFNEIFYFISLLLLHSFDELVHTKATTRFPYEVFFSKVVRYRISVLIR